MKKLLSEFKVFCLFVCCSFLLISCKRNELEQFRRDNDEAIEIAIESISEEWTRNLDELTIPMKLKLSSYTKKAFQVGLQFDNDTVQSLIDDNELQNVVLLSGQSVKLQNVVDVPFGVNELDFNIKVSVTALERSYGKNVAVALKLIEPGKGNKIHKKNNVAIIVFNTVDFVDQSKIRYISLAKGGGEILNVKNRNNYHFSSYGITIPLGIDLSGEPSGSFSVNVGTNRDTIAKLVQEGILPANTIALTSDQIEIDTLVFLPANQNKASLNLNVLLNTIQNNLDKQLAIVVYLNKTTRHILNNEKSMVIVLIDPVNVLEDVTNLARFSVSRDREEGNPEGASKLIDNIVATKLYLLGYQASEQWWLQFIYDKPISIKAYKLSSGNDGPDRDPRSWQIQGSNDGVNWQTIDTRTDEFFPSRLMTRGFVIASPGEFTHYRMKVLKNNGAGQLQFSEIRMLLVL